MISQDPTGGTLVAPGSAVDLVVSKGVEPVEVPHVVGMAQAEAETAITDAGLTVGTITEAYSDTVAEGVVISQDPVGGTLVDPGSAVDLVVSKGPEPVEVPNVVGMAQAAAETAITDVGLVVGTVTEEYSDTVPEGVVISQDPVGGTLVDPGSAVDLVVSKGPEPVEVPNVVGMAQADAETAITDAGLTVGTITEEYSDTVPEGDVISQDPVGGALVAPGSSVDLVVSKGVAPLVETPDVVGLEQAAAETAITGVGLVVGTVTEEYSDTVPEGVVISQDPVGGTMAALGSAVNLVVSKGVEQVEVPDVVGMAQAEAEATIIAAGLVVARVVEVYSDTVAEGVVAAQHPLAGALVLPGSGVTIHVSKGALPSGAIPISTIEELQLIGNDPAYPIDGDYIQIQDIDASATDTWNDGAGFAPLGSELVPFIGTYDGQNYYINELSIARPLEDAVGIFAYIGNAAVLKGVVVEGGSTISGRWYVGALVGSSGPLSTIEDCHSSAAVLGEIYVGGLVGANVATMLGCSATGIVSADNTCGGLVGVNWNGPSGGGGPWGDLQDCWTEAAVLAEGNDAGGLVGLNDGGTVTRSSANGPVSSPTGNNIGGLVGANSGSVEECFATGGVGGLYQVGGLIGVNWEFSACLRSYATGDAEGEQFVGGLVGNNFHGLVQQCYALGDATANAATEASVGGLAGGCWGEIDECYSVGVPTGTGRNGGLVGYQDPTDGLVTDSYWDKDTSGTTVSDGGVAKSTAEMTAQATFAGWDFAAVWAIDEGVTYPYFQWQP